MNIFTKLYHICATFAGKKNAVLLHISNNKTLQ